MSNPPFTPGAVHTEDEFEPDMGDPNWTVPEQPQQIPAQDPAASAAYEPQNSPLASAEEASKIAGAALHICDENNVPINGKLYLKVEAWNGIAWLAGLAVGIVPPVKDNVLGGVPGITARSVLKTKDTGKVISEAEGFCGMDEPYWASKPVSDRVNMAQTRAMGRVCRLVLSFIVQTMNREYGRKFEVTPYEEMLHEQAQAQPPQPQSPALGQRHVMPQQPTNVWPTQQIPQQPQIQGTWQPPTQPPQTVVYPDSHAFVPQPNVSQPVGQGPTESWQGQIRNIEIKWIASKQPGKPQSQLFIVHLTDGRNATTFDKTISGNLQMMGIGRNVEMLVQARGNGRYNITQVRPL